MLNYSLLRKCIMFAIIRPLEYGTEVAELALDCLAACVYGARKNALLITADRDFEKIKELTLIKWSAE